MARWWIVRGWHYTWALGLAVAAYALRSPYRLDALGSEIPQLLTALLAAAALANLVAGIIESRAVRLAALGICVGAMALRVTSATLVSQAAPEERMVAITVWAMLAVATILLTIVAAVIVRDAAGTGRRGS